ncbi:MAG: hypothetical protein WBQ17_16645 [Rhizomicrobium sp.]
MAADDLTTKVAWCRRDPTIERDARALWAQTGGLKPERADERLSELCVAAYSGDALAGISSAAIEYLEVLRCRLAVYRCLVASTARMKRVATVLALKSFDVLEAWSRDNPAEGVMGMGAVIQSRALVEHDRHAVWPDTKLTFVGFTDAGHQFRLKWFAHGVVADWTPPAKPPGAKS